MNPAARTRVVIVGKSRSRWAQEAVDDYSRRCRRFGGVDELVARSEVFRGDEDRVRAVESERVRALVAPRDRLVVLDERGDALDTPSFAGLIRAGRADARLVFALGGAYGHHETLRVEAWRVVRLSDLVLNHEVARVVLHEQIYRAHTVLEGAPYHHG